MSLQRSGIPPIPPETTSVAKAAFPSGNVSMQMRDELGSIYCHHLGVSIDNLKFTRFEYVLRSGELSRLLTKREGVGGRLVLSSLR